MHLAGIDWFLRILYDDKMSVYRNTIVQNEDGTKETQRNIVPSLTDIPCRLSLTQGIDYALGDPDHNNARDIGVNPVDLSPRIFLSPQYVIKEGDYIVLSRMNDDGTVRETLEGYIGKPSWYTSHQMCEFVVRRKA